MAKAAVPPDRRAPDRPPLGVAGALPLLAAGAGLAAAILAAYAGSLDAGLVYDNAYVILRAARVHAATWANVVEIFTTDYWWPFNVHGVYRPLTTLTYLVNWAILGSGPRPAGYHAVNLALHWMNALLLFAVARRAAGLATVPAFLIALVFATHPVATEAVTNVVGRADLLAATSVLGGLLLYVRAVRATTAAARRLWLAATAAVAFAGLLCKESAIVLLGAIAVYDLAFEAPLRDRLPAWRDRTRAIARIAATRWIALAPPLLAIALVRARVFRDTPPWTVGSELNPLAGADFLIARATALKALARAVWVLVWPARLCPDYSQDEIPLFAWPPALGDAAAPLALAGGAAAIGLFFALRRSHRAASFFLGLFLVAAFPTSNLLVLSTTLLAERLLYLPLAGFAGCLVLGVQALVATILRRVRRDRHSPRAPAERAVAAGTAVAIAALAFAYGVRTARRNADWSDETTLWTAALASCPASYRTHEMLGAALLNPLDRSARSRAEIDRVIDLQETAVAIAERASPPGVAVPPTTLERLAFLYFRKAQIADEDAAAGPAAPADGVAPAVAWSLKAADAFERAAAGFAAERELRRALYGARADRSPELAGPLLFDSLGLAQLRAGRTDRAIAAFERARAGAPWDVAYYEHLATALHRAGRGQDALLALVQATAVAPERIDLKRALVDYSARIRPDACGFTLEADRLAFAGDCADLQRLSCTAYARLLASLAGARGPDAPRAEEIARRARTNLEALGCAALGGNAPGASS